MNMFKNKNLDFELLLLDKCFVRIVKQDNNNSINYLDNLIRKNPDKKEAILCAAQFIRANKIGKELPADEEVVEIWENIMKKSKVTTTPDSNRFSISFLLRIAASITILALGSWYLLQLRGIPSMKDIADKMTVAGEEAVIVLSDGSSHILAKNDSRIEYKSDGKEVLINNSDHQVEKIENRKAISDEVLNQIIVPYGRRHAVTLSDGTKVQLNSGSKLVFPAEFKGKNREVFLEGEGFFDVEKNSSMPFIVQTEFMNIKVKGTRFNVSSYIDEHQTSTVLVEGSVEVSGKNKLINNSRYYLEPGQGCFYSVAASTAEVKEVDIKNHISWIDGWFQFKDQPLSEVVKKVEKYYNKTILIEGKNLSNTLISGKLVLSEKFDNVLVYLSKTLETNYELTEDGKYLIKNN